MLPFECDNQRANFANVTILSKTGASIISLTKKHSIAPSTVNIPMRIQNNNLNNDIISDENDSMKKKYCKIFEYGDITISHKVKI